MKAFKEDKKIAVADKEVKVEPVMDKDREDYLERLEGQQLKQKCSTLLNRAADSRKRYDWEWMVRDLFRRGYQFSKYNPTSRTVILSTRSSVKVPINLVASQMRVVRNQVTSFRPKWEVIPNGTSEQAKNNARYSQKVLDYYYDKLGFRKLNKEAITQGLMYSVGGPYQVVYSEEADNGKGDIAVWLTDPFDYYIDPYAQSQEDAEYCAKAVRRPLAEIKSNPNYKFYDQPITGDKRVAQSEYKQFLLMSLKQQSTGGTDGEEDEGVILKEMWMKVRVTEENEEKITKELKKNDQDVKDLRMGETVMRVVTFLDSLADPLKLQLLRRSDYPFVPYQADINPLEFYGEGWIKHVIPMNRVLNSLESSIFDYHYKFAKGRMVIDKNSGVRIVSNEHGSIIEKNKGAEVTALPIASLPQSYQMQIDNMRRYIEDIGGAHDVSLGRIPSGVKSGVGIAEMKAADACVDINTEALTRNGWKKYDELANESEIYVLDPETKKGRWGKLNKIFYYDKDNVDVYDFNSRNISVIATHDHSWMINNDHTGWNKRHSEELRHGDSIPLAVESSDIPTENTYTDDFVELAGWVITEGSYSVGPAMRARGSHDIKIYQSQVHPEEVERIRSLFERVGIKRKAHLDNRGCWHFVFAKDNALKIRELFPKKALTMAFVSRLTKQQLELLLDTMIKADGNERENNRRCFINTTKETIESVQHICTLLGIATNVSEYDDGDENHAHKFVLYLKKTSSVDVGSMLAKGTLTVKKFTGRVWCPNTDAGFWLARNDGKVFYTGNTNQADLVDNLEDCLVKVAQKILKEISEHFDVPKIMKVLGKSGNPEHFAIVGEKAAGRRSKDKVRIGVDEFDLAVIGADNEIRVTIGSWLAYTKDAQQDKLRELFQAGIIDQQTFLENAEFGDVQGIVERTRKEEMLKKLRGTPAQEGMPTDEEIAAQENNMLLREINSIDDAVAMVQDTDNHDIHIIVHQEALSNVDDPIVSAHISEHESRLGQRQNKVSRMATAVPGMNPEIDQGMGSGEEVPQEIPMGQPESINPEEQALMEAMKQAGA